MIPVTIGATENNLEITQKIPKNRTWKAKHQETSEESHIRHSTHMAGSINIKIKNIFNTARNITCSINHV